jgi:dipeptidyl aminopeptidase/acylaminoacyl peptidase
METRTANKWSRGARRPGSFAAFALALAALATGAASLPAQSRSAPDGAVLAVAGYVLPPYDSLSRDQRRELLLYTDRAEYDSTRAEADFVLRKVRYGSGGNAVVAYWYGPPTRAPRPAIIYNRGSWTAGDLAPALAPLFRRFASAGFTVLAPQYRGSDGGEGRDELGGADLTDLLVLPRVAAALGGIDSTRLFMYGESRGGMMTLQALREGMPLRAAATVGAFTDMDMMLRDDSASARAAVAIWPDLASRREEIVARRSAVRWADRIRAPLLILHGGADPQVSPAHSLELARRLEELRRTYELRVIAGEGHVIGKRSRERDGAVLAWFARYAHDPPGR